MIKKLIFLLILFVSPLFSPVFMANAAELTKNCFSLTLGLIDNSAETIVYSNGTNWYSDSSCLKQTTLTIPRRASDNALPVFFNTKCAAEETTHSATGTVTYPTTTLGATCTYSASDGLVCNITPDKITSNTSYCADTFASPTNLTSISAGRSSASLTYSASSGTCYAVTLNANGGTNGSPTTLYKKSGSTTWYKDSKCATTITQLDSIASKSGHSFNGYYTAASGGTQCITSSGALSTSTLCNITAATTLYARYTANSGGGTCYAVTLNVNGGTTNGSPTPLYKKSGSTTWYKDSKCTTTITQLDSNASKSGYSFNGYYTTASGGTQCITSSGALSTSTSCNVTAATTLYAQYTARCNTITLNANGGNTASVSVLYKKTGVTGWFTNSSCTTSYATTTNIVPTRDGYTFRGYFSTDLEDATSNASNETLYIQNTGASTLAGASWTPTTNTTIYAAWAKDCRTPDNGTCKLEITTATGDTTYNASCNSGYTLDNDGTANPTCTSNCKVITLKYQNQNGSTNIEERTISYNGTNWCSDSSCGRCGASFVDLFKRPSDDALPAYFSTSSTTSNYTLINTGSIKEINDSNTAYTCSYTDGELNCNVIPSTTTTLYAYVFVAPNLAGAVSGGGLLSFSTVSTSSKKTVTVSYKSATCSDAATVHFYGIKSDGTYDSVGTAKFYYDTENWGNSSGTIKTNFAGLGITNSFTNSVTVNGTTYPKGLSAYRAAWVGGEPRTQPTDMIITETTGIVSPDDNPYDIFVTGGANTLPNITAELFSATVPGSAKNVYYVLLYAANCVDPQGTVNHATCELTITPNGGAYYKNQCLSGYEIENMGTDTLPTTAITPFVVDINNTCEI